MNKHNNILSARIRSFERKIHSDIQEAYWFSIMSFYKNYTPKMYERTFSTFGASDAFDISRISGYQMSHTGLPLERNKKGINELAKFIPTYDTMDIEDNFAVVGINIDPSNISWSPYDADDTAWVFERTFVKGIHGFNKHSVNTGAAFFKYYNKYKSSVPKNMKIPPKKIMDKTFKKIKHDLPSKLDKTIKKEHFDDSVEQLITQMLSEK